MISIFPQSVTMLTTFSLAQYEQRTVKKTSEGRNQNKKINVI